MKGLQIQYNIIHLNLQMQLDWTSLYDYMSIFSQTEIKKKINKFYQSFYPLKFKKSGQNKSEIKQIKRGGLLGIIASYIQKILFTLQIYLQAEYFLSQGPIKQELKLSRMFVQIQKKNLQIALDLQSLVYIVNEMVKKYNEITDQKVQDRQYLQIKIICALNRLFEFFYALDKMKVYLPNEGYTLIDSTLHLLTIKVCEKSKQHIRLFPEIGEILIEILYFFSSKVKEPFNFYSHVREAMEEKLKNFPERIKKLIALIPNRQKTILVNLSDENVFQYVNRSMAQNEKIPKEPIQNYFRCEEQINSLIAQEENFVESILIPEKYRGKKQWHEKVFQQLVNLSLEKKKSANSKIVNFSQFKLSEDFPLKQFQ